MSQWHIRVSGMKKEKKNAHAKILEMYSCWVHILSKLIMNLNDYDLNDSKKCNLSIL